MAATMRVTKDERVLLVTLWPNAARERRGREAWPLDGRSRHESGHRASTTLLWDLAPARAVEDTPQGKILGKALVMMLDPRSHEQEVA